MHAQPTRQAARGGQEEIGRYVAEGAFSAPDKAQANTPHLWVASADTKLSLFLRVLVTLSPVSLSSAARKALPTAASSAAVEDCSLERGGASEEVSFFALGRKKLVATLSFLGRVRWPHEPHFEQRMSLGYSGCCHEVFTPNGSCCPAPANQRVSNWPAVWEDQLEDGVPCCGVAGAYHWRLLLTIDTKLDVPALVCADVPPTFYSRQENIALQPYSLRHECFRALREREIDALIEQGFTLGSGTLNMYATHKPRRKTQTGLQHPFLV